ncbi:hypothetical protein AB595_10240 [Massilia sp. WF1]|nr:hypothetical protein AM586_27295 [Massilia sp. WG5]KLU36803.1 hypothetical protein AB595_10240 [Massilia sp. WF1]
MGYFALFVGEPVHVVSVELHQLDCPAQDVVEAHRFVRQRFDVRACYYAFAFLKWCREDKPLICMVAEPLSEFARVRRRPVGFRVTHAQGAAGVAGASNCRSYVEVEGFSWIAQTPAAALFFTLTRNLFITIQCFAKLMKHRFWWQCVVSWASQLDEDVDIKVDWVPRTDGGLRTHGTLRRDDNVMARQAQFFSDGITENFVLSFSDCLICCIEFKSAQ